MLEIWEVEADGRGIENVDVRANREAGKPRKHSYKIPLINHLIHPPAKRKGSELLKPLSNISVVFPQLTCDRNYRLLQFSTSYTFHLQT